METGQEVVYRTQEDSHVVMSEKVQSLAGSIYQEFEKMIGKYDHEVVKDLMPLIVNVLECLDMSYSENQEHEVELELLREDNEQLVTQYEREKQLRKSSEQKLLEVEDAVEDERKDLVGKIESLESIVRMLELKSKNASDHVFRLEEKESEMKKEYSKLHERYTELFKTHVDYMERTKLLMSSSERMDQPQSRSSRLPSTGVNQLSRSSGPVSFGFQSLENTAKDISIGLHDDELTAGSPPDSTNSNTSLRNELNETQDNLASNVAVEANKNNLWLGLSDSGSKQHSPDDEYDDMASNVTTPLGRSTTQREQRSGNTLYQELSFQDAEASGEIDDMGEVTGGWVHPGEYASSGMGKEVENLIMENNELLATKNALNIVKDDLIVKVDELTSDQEILREEMKSLHALKTRLSQRVADLEEELKKVKEEAAKQTKGNKSDEEEEEVPMAQRKRFTRVEMARVLMERNQYKERFMELQEAVRWTEMLRASRTDITLDKQKGQTMWTFFSKLFRMSGDKDMPLQPPPPSRKVNHHVNLLYAPSTLNITPTLATVREASGGNEKKKSLDYLDNPAGNSSSEKLAFRRASERKEQYRQVRAHVRKDDGRLQAYGWSLPAKLQPNHPSIVDAGATGNRSQVPVPVPVYCRPLVTNESVTKVSFGKVEMVLLSRSARNSELEYSYKKFRTLLYQN